MKKILLSLSLVGLVAFNSCKDEKQTAGNENEIDSTATTIDSTATNTQTETTSTEATSTEATATETTSTELPKFADKDVQEFVESYATFIKENKETLKDPSKISEITPKLQEWTQKSAPLLQKLANNPEELKKFQEYLANAVK